MTPPVKDNRVAVGCIALVGWQEARNNNAAYAA